MTRLAAVLVLVLAALAGEPVAPPAGCSPGMLGDPPAAHYGETDL